MNHELYSCGCFTQAPWRIEEKVAGGRIHTLKFNFSIISGLSHPIYSGLDRLAYLAGESELQQSKVIASPTS